MTANLCGAVAQPSLDTREMIRPHRRTSGVPASSDRLGLGDEALAGLGRSIRGSRAPSNVCASMLADVDAWLAVPPAERGDRAAVLVDITGSGHRNAVRCPDSVMSGLSNISGAGPGPTCPSVSLAGMRRYPFVPGSTADLQIGDLWTVPLKGGDLAVLQVRGLKTSGAGAHTHFVTAVVDWRSPIRPVGHDLRGRRVLVEGVTRFEVFAPGRAEVFGNSEQTVPPPAWSEVARQFAAGTSSEVWAWKSIRRRAERALAEAR